VRQVACVVPRRRSRTRRRYGETQQQALSAHEHPFGGALGPAARTGASGSDRALCAPTRRGWAAAVSQPWLAVVDSSGRGLVAPGRRLPAA